MPLSSEDRLTDLIGKLMRTSCRILEARLQDPELAEELTAAAVRLLFEKLLSGKAPSLEEKNQARLLSWILKCAAYLQRQRAGKHARQKRLRETHYRRRGVVATDDCPKANDGGRVFLRYSTDFGIASDEELERAFEASIGELDAFSQAVLRLRAWDGKALAEVASELQVTIGRGRPHCNGRGGKCPRSWNATASRPWRT